MRPPSAPEPHDLDSFHALLEMQAGQVSDGKYDENGRSVDVAGAACPVQKIEIVTHRETKPSPLDRRLLASWLLPCERTSGTGSSGATTAGKAVAAHDPCSLFNICREYFKGQLSPLSGRCPILFSPIYLQRFPLDLHEARQFRRQ